MSKSLTFVILLAGILLAHVSCSKPRRRGYSSKAPSSSSNTPPSNDATISNNDSTPSSATSDKPDVDNDAPWILPGFDKKQPPQIAEKGRKCWQDANYNVCLTENANATKLDWKNEKSKVQVEIIISKNGKDIKQKWRTPDNHVQLNVKEDGSLTQLWKVGQATLEWRKNSEGKISSRWHWSQNAEKVEEFKKFIDSWCDNNLFFIAKENCAIYDKSNAENSPASVQSEFYENQASSPSSSDTPPDAAAESNIESTPSSPSSDTSPDAAAETSEIEPTPPSSSSDTLPDISPAEPEIKTTPSSSSSNIYPDITPTTSEIEPTPPSSSSDTLPDISPAEPEIKTTPSASSSNIYPDITPTTSEIEPTPPSSSPNTPQDVAIKTNTKSTPSSGISDEPDVDTAPWILPGFDTNQVSRLGKSGKKCWQEVEKYHVCFTKYIHSTKLYWKNEESDLQVEIEVSNDGEYITQTWRYGGDNVHLSIQENGSMEQYWKLGKSKLEWRKNFNGKIYNRWSGSENPQAMEKFKKVIDSWCDNNDFFVPKEHCVIYADKAKADEPAWILPGFDRNLVSQHNTNGKKCWQSTKYHVCLTKGNDSTELIWNNKKSNFQVEIVISDNGEIIVQDWKYQEDHVQLSITQDDGSMAQYWKLGNSTFQWRKYSDGEITSRWTGSKDPQSVEKFKKIIDSWCENNDYFVGTENCAIYAETKVTSDPAWILPGFDYTQVLRLNKNGKKCWQEPKYHVCLTKTQTNTKLNWNNNKSMTKVEMDISSDGDIFQNWTQQGKNVQLNLQKDGSMTQTWRFGSSVLQINKYADGTSTSKWYGGIKHPEELKKYQQFIDSWCDSNGFFVEKEHCVIY